MLLFSWFTPLRSGLSWREPCCNTQHATISISPFHESHHMMFVPVHTFHDLGPDERAFCYNAFQRHHVVEVGRGECSRIAGVLSEAANVCAVVHLVVVLVLGSSCSRLASLPYRLFCRLKRRPVAQCVHNVFQSSVEGLRVVEGLVEQAIC